MNYENCRDVLQNVSTKLGFNTMIYQDPCCGSQIPADTIVDMNASVDTAMPDSGGPATTVAPAAPAKSS